MIGDQSADLRPVPTSQATAAAACTGVGCGVVTHSTVAQKPTEW
jgi:hypothetical protein